MAGVKMDAELLPFSYTFFHEEDVEPKNIRNIRKKFTSIFEKFNEM
jgi:hypothetical protein